MNPLKTKKKSTPEKPRWYMVDIEFVSKVANGEEPLALPQIKADPKLADIYMSGLLACMVVATFSTIAILGPQTVALQERAFEAISEQEKDLAYGQFFRLHMIVRLLHVINRGLAASLFVLKLRKTVLHHFVPVP